MQITNKQKKKLIQDLVSPAPQGRAPRRQRQNASPRIKTPVVRRERVGPARTGISNVQGQDTSIPLSQTFAGSESLGRFNGSAAFTATQLPINPGQAGTFPWLSQEAKLWEKYEFDKLEFEFRTTINEFSANALGRVIIGVDFDASDPPPSTRSQAEISRPVTAQAPYYNQLLRLRKADLCDTVKRHYVRPGPLPGASDIKMYDVGVLNYCTDGNVNGNEVGELWVHYTGTFHTQILESVTAAPTNNQVAFFQSAAPEALATGVNFTPLLATASANGISAVNTAGSIVLPAGNYLLDWTGQFGFSVDFQSLNLSMLKNGVLVTTSAAIDVTSGAGDLAANVNGSGFVSSNGTDAFTLRANAVFAAGTGNITATLRIVSI